MSIRLHPKYGVNPTVSQCFYCQEAKNELALLGSAYKGEAPRQMILNKEPCDKCKEWMKKGVILISVRDGAEDDNPYRTGGWVVLSEDAIRRVITSIPARQDLLTRRVGWIHDKTWHMLGLPLSEHQKRTMKPKEGDANE